MYAPLLLNKCMVRLCIPKCMLTVILAEKAER